MRIVRSDCPACESENLRYVLKAIDHTVSGEEFEIWECKNCTLRFTQSIPAEDEIAGYYKSQDYISHSDTKKGLVNFLYHIVRKRTTIQKNNLIKKNTGLSKGNLLDIGCGTGYFLFQMKQAGWNITGLEPDETARRKAKELYNLNLQHINMLFSVQQNSFDAISLWHVLEHVHDLHKYMRQLKEIIKPGGRIFIAVPNYTCYDESVYKSSWAAYDVPRHLYHFSPDSMTKLLLKHGLVLQSVKPMFYDSFYVSMLSEKYKRGKNSFLPAIWTGLISNCKALLDKKKCSSLIYLISK